MALAVLFGGVVALLPIFFADVLHAGPTTLGILLAAPFVGSVSMGIAVLHYPAVENTGRKLLWAVAGQCHHSLKNYSATHAR